LGNGLHFVILIFWSSAYGGQDLHARMATRAHSPGHPAPAARCAMVKGDPTMEALNKSSLSALLVKWG
jgi:hypothetical protein